MICLSKRCARRIARWIRTNREYTPPGANPVEFYAEHSFTGSVFFIIDALTDVVPDQILTYQGMDPSQPDASLLLQRYSNPNNSDRFIDVEINLGGF